MSEHPINEMMNVAMGKIKEMINSDTVIGEPIVMPNGVTAVPICRVNMGFASGGSDLPKQTSERELFGGGAGGGVSIVPIAFLVTTKEGVRLIQLDTAGNTADNIVRTVPEVIDKISGLVSNGKNKKD